MQERVTQCKALIICETDLGFTEASNDGVSHFQIPEISNDYHRTESIKFGLDL